MSDATVTMLRSRADRFGLCHTSPYRSSVVWALSAGETARMASIAESLADSCPCAAVAAAIDSDRAAAVRCFISIPSASKIIGPGRCGFRSALHAYEVSDGGTGD